MALYVLVNGRESIVMDDLRIICGRDPGLTFKFPSGQVIYNPTISWVGSELVRVLALPDPRGDGSRAYVAVRGETADFGISAPGQRVMRDQMGYAVHDAYPARTVEIVYDVTDCNGKGYVVYDALGNQLAYPRHISLFHELTHALRLISGTMNSTLDFGAINDENVYRDALGTARRGDLRGGCRP